MQEMQKKKAPRIIPEPRWMTECDVIRYNLRIPQNLKEQLKKEALDKEMSMSSYICGLIDGNIKRKKSRR
jgi:predicted HicB family RNase H-like nuclease